MKIISDLHLHSKYSRATSKQLDIANLEKWAKIKGLNLLGTGDFTHPEWIKELKSKLTGENGIFKSAGGMNWVLQAEVSLIYSDMGKGRRVHNVILAPSFDVVEQITEYFLKHGRIDYDGRPIFKIPSDELVYELLKISKDIEVIPAHILTPWFSLFGSMSGYDNIKDCFKDQTNNIHALETGLSSDPAMDRRLSQLDPFALVSFSDSHSFWPWRIGREATMFDLKELTYNNLIKALKTKKGLLGTLEISPFLGKYHLTGHRACKVCLEPRDSLKLKDICPKCGRKLTVGVAQRVEELADRPEGYKPKDAASFKTIIALSELLAKILKKGIATRNVWNEYNKIVNHFGSEFEVLLNASKEELNKVTDEKTSDVILKNREGKIDVKGGYDGVYGIPVIDEEDEIQDEELITKPKQKQTGLGEFM